MTSRLTPDGFSLNQVLRARSSSRHNVHGKYAAFIASRRVVMKKLVIVAAAFLIAISIGYSYVSAQTVRSEEGNHPRIAAAIRELEEAIRYMEAAPHDFGGHKGAAIRDSRAAVMQLKLALGYRARHDR
jgi:hypothetical protein